MRKQMNDRECVGERKEKDSYHRLRQDAPDTYDAPLQLVITSIKYTCLEHCRRCDHLDILGVHSSEQKVLLNSLPIWIHLPRNGVLNTTPSPQYDVSTAQQDLVNESLSLYTSFTLFSHTHLLFPDKQSLVSSLMHRENELWRRWHEYEVHSLSICQVKYQFEQIDVLSSLHDGLWDRDTSDDLLLTTKNSERIIRTFNVSFCWFPFTPNLHFSTLSKPTAKWTCEDQNWMTNVEWHPQGSRHNSHSHTTHSHSTKH